MARPSLKQLQVMLNPEELEHRRWYREPKNPSNSNFKFRCIETCRRGHHQYQQDLYSRSVFQLPASSHAAEIYELESRHRRRYHSEKQPIIYSQAQNLFEHQTYRNDIFPCCSEVTRVELPKCRSFEFAPDADLMILTDGEDKPLKYEHQMCKMDILKTKINKTAESIESIEEKLRRIEHKMNKLDNPVFSVQKKVIENECKADQINSSTCCGDCTISEEILVRKNALKIVEEIDPLEFELYDDISAEFKDNWLEYIESLQQFGRRRTRAIVFITDVLSVRRELMEVLVVNIEKKYPFCSEILSSDSKGSLVNEDAKVSSAMGEKVTSAKENMIQLLKLLENDNILLILMENDFLRPIDVGNIVRISDKTERKGKLFDIVMKYAINAEKIQQLVNCGTEKVTSTTGCEVKTDVSGIGVTRISLPESQTAKQKIGVVKIKFKEDTNKTQKVLETIKKYKTKLNNELKGVAEVDKIFEGSVVVSLKFGSDSTVKANTVLKVFKRFFMETEMARMISAEEIHVDVSVVDDDTDGEDEELTASKLALLAHYDDLLEEIDAFHYKKIFCERKIMDEETFDSTFKICSSRRMKTRLFLEYILNAPRFIMDLFMDSMKSKQFTFVANKIRKSLNSLKREYQKCSKETEMKREKESTHEVPVGGYSDTKGGKDDGDAREGHTSEQPLKQFADLVEEENREQLKNNFVQAFCRTQDDTQHYVGKNLTRDFHSRINSLKPSKSCDIEREWYRRRRKSATVSLTDEMDQLSPKDIGRFNFDNQLLEKPLDDFENKGVKRRRHQSGGTYESLLFSKCMRQLQTENGKTGVLDCFVGKTMNITVNNCTGVAVGRNSNIIINTDSTPENDAA